MIVLSSVQAGIISSSSFDKDALSYIKAIETADGSSLEMPVKLAIDNFVKGCKGDGIWSAIMSCCIFAGARTLNGALVPLKGSALTNNLFTSAHYADRKNGILGGGTRYLNTNTTNLIDANNKDTVHAAAFTTSIHAGYILGSDSTLNGSIGLRPYNGASSLFRVHNGGSVDTTSLSPIAGFVGASRNNGTSMNIMLNT
ncbi:hypothetical protein EBU71_19670, partial [bacterium]|nr:hypothetical protein [Candidatus Elulimicrobium humile]